MRLAVVLALAACSQPGVRGPDRDDTRGGARTAARSSRDINRWTLEGGLDEDDRVDWIFVDIPAEVAFHVDVSVITEDSREGFDSEVYAVDGRFLARTDTESGLTGSSDIRSVLVEHQGPVYVRIATNERARRGRYTAIVQRKGRVVRELPRRSCNPDAFDPTNPECKGRCDYKHPDPNNVDCCMLWMRCQDQKYGRTCTSDTLTWDGDHIVLPLGLDHGVYGRPWAILRLDQMPPPVADEDLAHRRRKPIELEIIAIETTRSIWALRDRRTHDLSWLKTHARGAAIQIPVSCP